jgi:two-component system, OmpR family, response regulator
MAKNGKKVRIYSALEVANICGVVNQTAINWIKNGYLKAFTTPGGQYRVYAEDLLSFLQSRGMRVPDELYSQMQDEPDWSKVLVVDDDRELNDLIKRFFAKRLEDHEILQAFDGFEAGRMLAEHRPGTIILDIDLPGIDGHKLCRRIKDDAGLGSPMIISVTGLDDPQERESILRDGADAFFGKPVDLDRLADTVLELSEKYRGVNES